MDLVFHPHFAAFYNWMTERRFVHRYEDPWRREVVGQASGVVLEVGAGGGQNFPFYDQNRVTRVEATEPDEAMLAFARQRIANAPVPMRLTRAPVEELPFPDEQFDTVVVTIVFCSVGDTERGLQELRRVLKPGGVLLMLEHVRANTRRAAWLQDVLVPVTTRLSGNCHWNRDTERAVVGAGFEIVHVRAVRGGLQPVIMLQAIRPPVA